MSDGANTPPPEESNTLPRLLLSGELEATWYGAQLRQGYPVQSQPIVIVRSSRHGLVVARITHVSPDGREARVQYCEFDNKNVKWLPVSALGFAPPDLPTPKPAAPQEPVLARRTLLLIGIGTAGALAATLLGLRGCSDNSDATLHGVNVHLNNVTPADLQRYGIRFEKKENQIIIHFRNGGAAYIHFHLDQKIPVSQDASGIITIRFISTANTDGLLYTIRVWPPQSGINDPEIKIRHIQDRPDRNR